MFELFAISLQIKIGVSLQIDWHPAMNSRIWLLIKIQCESHLNLYFELNMDPVQSQKGMQSSAGVSSSSSSSSSRAVLV